MTDEELIRQIKKQACGCDPVVGRCCTFCRELLPELRKALKVKYRKTESPYKPKKMRRPEVDPGLRW